MATEKQLLETWEQAIEDALQELHFAKQEDSLDEMIASIGQAETKLEEVKNEIWQEKIRVVAPPIH